MITIIRTDNTNKDFQKLVLFLDADLAIRDGDDHEFYNQFNKIDNLDHVIIVFENDLAIGCGALKKYTSNVCEIKRMYTDPKHRGKGIASKTLAELEVWAQELSFDSCILETGIRQPEAIRLYEKNGYQRIPNYGQYQNINDSLCFKKDITTTNNQICGKKN